MFRTEAAPMTNNSSQVRQNQVVNQVFKTYDLSIFKDIKGNRIPNLQHVKRISESIKVYGMKCNPILVNEKMQIIDGQHRLLAAKEVQTYVYYIIINGYSLSEVHTLNLNQKNWTKRDYMNAYANMGVESYVKLKRFTEKNSEFTLVDCIAMCSNVSYGNYGTPNKFRSDGNTVEIKEIFNEGTWVGKDFDLAQDNANRLKMIQPYYSNYSKTTFVGCMLSLLKNNNFSFIQFINKLKIQPTALVDCRTRDQYRTLIEDIYNYKQRNKISLKY